MNKFKFKLSLEHCVYEDDAMTTFKARELEDGSYLISWHTKHGHAETEYSSADVLEAVAEGHWIVVE